VLEEIDDVSIDTGDLVDVLLSDHRTVAEALLED
jgi:hypothetical protein